MSGSFSVDLAALDRIGTGISQGVASLGTRAVAPANGSAVGHDGLASALEKFGARWQQGVQHLAEAGQRFTGELSGTARAYQEVEQRIAYTLRAQGQ